MTSPRRAGRPRAGQPALRREDLLAAAARAFSNGYASASVRRMAAELGVSQSAVQHHAPTKEALLFAVIDELLAPQLAATASRAQQVGSAASADDSAAAGLHSLLRARLTALAEHGGLVLSVLQDTSPGAERRRGYLLDRLLPLRRAGLSALAGLADRGVTRRLSDTTWMALVLVAIPSIARAWTHVDALTDDRRSLEQTLDEVADLLVHGLALEA